MNSHDEQDASREYDADVRVLLQRLWRAIIEYIVEDISLIDYLDRAVQEYTDLLNYSNCEYFHPLNLYFDMWEIAQKTRVGGPLKVKLEELFDLRGEPTERQSWMELTENIEPLLHSLESHFDEQDLMYELGGNILSEFTHSPGQWDVQKLERQLSDIFEGLPDLVFELRHYIRVFAKAMKGNVNRHGNQSYINEVTEEDNISSNVGLGGNEKEQQGNPTEVGVSKYSENPQLQHSPSRDGKQSNDVANDTRGLSMEAATSVVTYKKRKSRGPYVMTTRYKLRDRRQNSK